MKALNVATLAFLALIFCNADAMMASADDEAIEKALRVGSASELTAYDPNKIAEVIVSMLRKNKRLNLAALPDARKKLVYEKAPIDLKKQVLRSFGFASVQDVVNFGSLPDLYVHCAPNCSAKPRGIGLDLSGIGLTSLEGLETIKAPQPLVYLDLKNNNLSTLPQDPFSRFTDLEMLDLSNNKLSQLPEHLFERNRSLRGISFRNNRLTKLPEDLKWWPILVALELSGNPLPLTELEIIFKNVPRRDGNEDNPVPSGVATKLGTNHFRYPDATIMSPCCMNVIRDVTLEERTIIKDPTSQKRTVDVRATKTQPWPERRI